MKTLIHATGAALLATASMAAQADTFSFTSEFSDLTGFATGTKDAAVTTDTLTKGGDSFALFNNANDFLTYTFSIASATDVAIKFWSGSSNKDKLGSLTVSWLDSLDDAVTLAGGSSVLTFSPSFIDGVAPSPAGDLATYNATGLAAGTYTFRIDSNSNRDFRVDTFSAVGTNVTPVPEPETYAMMLAGLGAIGYLGRRRKMK
ncbi:protein of unknown function DUF1555 [Leptothrix cholodnii SP-6]|uniref:Ice-binding protein C-terminal domain-containing protein n=1 Tax=Leptothrix cholodnii (strain ATCC 51168 / LMG 8142 / SP-6) TaxID=395495 RepID=B1Y3U2_LEPCP|nr:FxDxF family PEP-CTERM protein [Leptothrix cholodnii]ACB33336.1 protein of unknown function DUF1555 [Leptothrix cholodnii SP-6]